LGFTSQVPSVEVRLPLHYHFINFVSFVVISNKPALIHETESVEPYLKVIAGIGGW
jgi:hypothetical protein